MESLSINSFFIFLVVFFFFFNDPATTEIYTLSLHDALPISTFRRLSSMISRCLRFGLELVEQRIEAPVVPFPQTAIAFQPLGSFSEPLGLEAARPPLRVAAARNQAGALQHLQVLGDRRLAHRERLGP